MSTVEVHILSHDDEPMLEWALRHYRTFAEHIIVHDGGPDGVQSKLCSQYGAAVLPWQTEGKLNDDLAYRLKNTCWRGSTADWVICVDADELLYFPGGAEPTLDTYERMGGAVPRPLGFEMFSEVFPAGQPGQIYDHVKEGARDDKWYAKPVLFSPRLIAESGFGIGAHESRPVLRDGRSLQVDQGWPQADPAAYLLHFHQVGPIERIASRYDATRRRLSPINERCRWGNFSPGLEHAQEKRAYILPRLQKVIA